MIKFYCKLALLELCHIQENQAEIESKVNYWLLKDARVVLSILWVWHSLSRRISTRKCFLLKPFSNSRSIRHGFRSPKSSPTSSMWLWSIWKWLRAMTSTQILFPVYKTSSNSTRWWLSWKFKKTYFLPWRTYRWTRQRIRKSWKAITSNY